MAVAKNVHDTERYQFCVRPPIAKEIVFQWNSVSGASNYEIEVATDDNMQNIVADVLYLEYYQSEIDALRIIRRDVK